MKVGRYTVVVRERPSGRGPQYDYYAPGKEEKVISTWEILREAEIDYELECRRRGTELVMVEIAEKKK